MNLIHYSPRLLSKATLISKEQDENSYLFGKPRGLWVSVQGEYDWAEWCQGEGFSISPMAYQIKLKKDAEILYLTSPAEMEEFQEKFGRRGTPFFIERWVIDWTRVASKYQGIIIAPYHWECRLKMDWYYGWDCQSGCIWDRSAIQSVQRMLELDPPTAAKADEMVSA